MLNGPLYLPTEGAAEAVVAGSATQAAGAEDVVAVQETGLLVLPMAQQTHQGMAAHILRLPQSLIAGRENASRHLTQHGKAERRPSIFYRIGTVSIKFKI